MKTKIKPLLLKNNFLSVVALFTMLLVVAILPAAAQGLKVTTSGGQPNPNQNDGSTWDKALSAAQLAQRLTDYVFNGDPDGSGEYWLAKGAYPGLWLHRGTVILGGFAGAETTKFERDPSTNIVTIAGTTIAGYHQFVVGSDGHGDYVLLWPDGGTQVDGCTIYTGGSAMLLGNSDAYPPGTPPVVSHCTIIGGGSSGVAAAYVTGGQFRMEDCEIKNGQFAGVAESGSNTTLELLRCQIHDSGGAGVFAGGGGTLTMTDCSVIHNCTDPAGPGADPYGYWGAIHLYDPSVGTPVNISATLRHCDISQNQSVGLNIARFTGAPSDRKVLIEDCTITNNVELFGAGGGVRCYVADRRSADDVTFTNCRIVNNSAQTGGLGGSGGGFHVIGESVRVEGCVIAGNTAIGTGGAVRLQISPADASTAVPTFRDCLISGNSAGGFGGAFDLESANPKIVNCTIADNHAAAQGGAIYSYQNKGNFAFPVPAAAQYPALVANCAFAGNTASEGTVLFHTYGNYQDAEDGAPLPPTTINCTYLNGETWIRYWPIQGSHVALTLDSGSFAVADSGFVDGAAGDFHLTAGSLLRDQGDNSLVEAGELDLDAQPRIAGSAVDIGAFEFAAATPTTPPLYIGYSGNTVKVYWRNVSGWSLEQNNNLAMSANWSVNSSWTTSNGTNYLSFTSPTGNLFFRLKQQ
jgi:Right handed beta helix region